jgi:hypothetical protein
VIQPRTLAIICLGMDLHKDSSPTFVPRQGDHAAHSDNNGSHVTGVSVDDRADLDIMELVKLRDSIQTISDTVARRHATERLRRPNGGPFACSARSFVGRDRSKNVILNLADSERRARLRLVVDSLGTARVTNSVTGGVW